MNFTSIPELQSALRERNYIAEHRLATSLYLTLKLKRPLFLEGEPLVIIADISGSMERYTRILLHFIYGMKSALTQSVEAFVFSTLLTRITRPLQIRDLDLALKNVNELVHDWAGGTRIGESLKNSAFNGGVACWGAVRSCSSSAIVGTAATWNSWTAKWRV